MGSMKAQAIEELKSHLLERFGDSKEVSEVLDREIAAFFSTRSKIVIEDLDAFNNRLVTVLGFPARRRSQWAKLSSRSLASSHRYSQAAQDATTVPAKSRLATRSLDLKYPPIADIVPITRHWKPVATKRDSPIFPRYENRALYTPSPERVNVTDTMRTTFNWRYGETEERVNRSLAPDEWGDITKWDTSKYIWEQDGLRRQTRAQQQEYREFLEKQVAAHLQQQQARKAELTKEKEEALEQDQRERAHQLQQVREHRQKHEVNQQTLKELIADKLRRKQVARERKQDEGKRIRKKHDSDLAEEIQTMQERKMRNLSLTDHNMKTLAERQEEQRLRKLASRMEDLRRAEAAAKQIEDVEHQRRQLSLNLAKTAQEENQLLVAQKGPLTPESVHTAHGELFRSHEARVRQMKHQVLQNVAVLTQQMQEKTLKDGEWKTLHEEQAHLWRAEHSKQVQEDAAAAIARKRQQQTTKQSLLEQMEARRQAKFHARRLSPAEAKLNRHLLKVACGLDSI